MENNDKLIIAKEDYEKAWKIKKVLDIYTQTTPLWYELDSVGDHEAKEKVQEVVTALGDLLGYLNQRPAS